VAELKETQIDPELFDGPSPPRRRMTEDEFVAWCNEDVRAEWVNGEVIELSPASTRHNRLFAFLFPALREFAAMRGLGEVLGYEMRVRFPSLQQHRVPDLLFISKERLHLLHPNHFEGAPDLVVEIVSPDSVERDWHEKYQAYQQAGVREYWVIDPLQQRLVVYGVDAEGTYHVLPEVEGRVSSGVLPGFYLKNEWLWPEPPPSSLAALRELGIIS
jgi:Uma2 family endonuclease